MAQKRGDGLRVQTDQAPEIARQGFQDGQTFPEGITFHKTVPGSRAAGSREHRRVVNDACTDDGRCRRGRAAQATSLPFLWWA